MNQKNHATCEECQTKIKQNIAEDSDQWDHTEDGWLCPHCNPNSDASWGSN